MIQIGMEIGTCVDEFFFYLSHQRIWKWQFFLSHLWLKCSADYYPGMAEISVAYFLLGHISQICHLYIRFNLLTILLVLISWYFNNFPGVELVDHELNTTSRCGLEITEVHIVPIVRYSQRHVYPPPPYYLSQQSEFLMFPVLVCAASSVVKCLSFSCQENLPE